MNYDWRANVLAGCVVIIAALTGLIIPLAIVLVLSLIFSKD